MNRDMLEWILIALIAPAAVFLLLRSHLAPDSRGIVMGFCFAIAQAAMVIRKM